MAKLIIKSAFSNDNGTNYLTILCGINQSNHFNTSSSFVVVKFIVKFVVKFAKINKSKIFDEKTTFIYRNIICICI